MAIKYTNGKLEWKVYERSDKRASLTADEKAMKALMQNAVLGLTTNQEELDIDKRQALRVAEKILKELS